VAYSALGLDINAKKTQFLYQPAPGKPDSRGSATVNGQPLENVSQLTYLGCCLSQKADIDKNIQNRLCTTSVAVDWLRRRVFGNREPLIETKLTV